MRALRYHGRRDLRIDEIKEPTAGPGEVKVRITACGICGSDVNEYVRGPSVIPTVAQPHRLTGATLPLVLGHEYAGMIIALGEGTPSRLALGQHVAIEPLINCGRCRACWDGVPNLCRRQAVVGLSAPSGGFAPYSVVPHRLAHPLPVGVDGNAGALVEPIAVGWHGVRLSGFGPDDRALVIGAGPIGLGVLMSLTAAKASRVVLSVRRDGARANLARALGASVILSDDGPAWRAALELTDGDGFDVVYITAGVPAAIDTALRSVRAGGTIVQLALWDDPAPVDLNRLLAREVRLIGSMGYTSDFPAVISAIGDGRIPDPTVLVTRKITLEHAIDEGFERLAAHDPDQVKILVAPQLHTSL